MDTKGVKKKNNNNIFYTKKNETDDKKMKLQTKIITPRLKKKKNEPKCIQVIPFMILKIIDSKNKM